MTRVQLSEQRANDLVKLFSLEPDQVSAIIASLEASDIILTPDELEQKLAETVDDEGLRTAIVQQSLMLNGIRRRRGFDSDEVRKYFDDYVSSEVTSVAPEVFENLQRLLFHPKIDIAAKATDLAFDFANILHTANVITDIRPVFNSEATDINGCVISFTLRIQYAGTSGRQNISIAMDERDVSKLAHACTRALTKAETITGKFDADRMGFRTIVTGKKS